MDRGLFWWWLKWFLFQTKQVNMKFYVFMAIVTLWSDQAKHTPRGCSWCLSFHKWLFIIILILGKWPVISGEAAKYYDSKIVTDKTRGVLCMDYGRRKALASARFFGVREIAISEVWYGVIFGMVRVRGNGCYPLETIYSIWTCLSKKKESNWFMKRIYFCLF